MTAIDEAPEINTEPVELDPPDPAVTRWKELASREVLIQHGGDAEKVMPFPRPAWADPDEDLIANERSCSYYRSPYVHVDARNAKGENGNGALEPAHVSVSARIHATGLEVIGLGMARVQGDEWLEHGIGISPEAAVELAQVLLAAVDLLGGAK